MKKREDLYEELKKDLVSQYGQMIGGSELAKVLGYKSLVALRKARLRGAISIPLFTPVKRRTSFALTVDVADWLVEQRDKGGV